MKRKLVITSAMLSDPFKRKYRQAIPLDDSEEKIIEDWNGDLDSESKTKFDSFEDLYRWLKDRARYQGKGKKDYYRKLDVYASENFRDDIAKKDDYLRTIKKSSKQAWSMFYYFLERAKKVRKDRKGLQ